MADLSTTSLADLTESGQPVETRLEDPQQVADLVSLMEQADETRSFDRSKVEGLVNGNPPFDPVALRNAGQADRCNVNWRQAEAFLSAATGVLYDIQTAAKTYAMVTLDNDVPADKKVEFADIITEEFDELNRSDDDLDFMLQNCNRETVLYGAGPAIWNDPNSHKAESIQYKDILFFDEESSNINEWEICAILKDYQIHELWAAIENEEAAERMGWNTDAVKEAIRTAMPRDERGRLRSWEYWQDKLREGDLYYTHSTKSSVIRAAIVFVRELDKPGQEGIITQDIVLRDHVNNEFLYQSIRKYDSWKEVISPLYWDTGNAKHYGVKGLGVKFFAALEASNRLQCSIVDAAFARMTIMLKPNTSEQLNKLQTISAGPYSVLPKNVDFIQQNIAGILDAPFQTKESIEAVLRSNLAQYNTGAPPVKQGNPISAREATLRIQVESQVSQSQLTRVLTQLDDFWSERYNRAVSASNNTPEAKEFQAKMEARGVDPNIFRNKVKAVRASRSVGMGSISSRLMFLQQMMERAPMLPQPGQQNLINDWIATMSSQDMVDRYNPQFSPNPTEQNQQWEASQENMEASEGVDMPVMDYQDDVIHATSHLTFGSQIANGIEQMDMGAMAKATMWYQTMVKHVGFHLGKIQANPLLQEEFNVLNASFNEMQKTGRQLASTVEQMQAQAQQDQAGAQEVMSKEQAKQQAFINEEARRDAETQNKLQRASAKTAQDMSIQQSKFVQEQRLQNERDAVAQGQEQGS